MPGTGSNVKYQSEEIVLPVHKTLFDLDRKCLFIFKAKGTPEHRIYKPVAPPPSENECNVEESFNGHAEDFAGTPLECPFDLNVLKLSDDSLLPLELAKSVRSNINGLTSDEYIPFTEVEARSILNEISLKNSSLPVFVLCDGAELQRITLLGLEKVDTRTAKNYEVTLDGPVSLKHKDIQLEALKQRMSFYCNNSPYKTVAYAEYSAYQREVLDEQDQSLKSYMHLAFSWENPRKILETPLLPTGSISVTLRPACGEEASPNYNLWLQIKALKNFITGLKSQEIAWNAESQPVNLIKEVDKLLMGSFEEQWQTRSCFTNQLWELLSTKCTSFQALVEALNYILRKTRQENILIASGWNKTKLGSLLTDMGSDVRLEENTEPLNLLIDIGIHKLRDDCIDFLAGHGVVTETELLEFLPKDTVSFEESYNQLEATLYAIEALTLCHRILRLDYLALKFVVMPLLKHYKQNKGEDFNFQINAAMLPYFFENKTVNVDKWRIQFVSSDPEYSVKFVCLLKPCPTYAENEDGARLENGPVDRVVNVEYLLSIQC